MQRFQRIFRNREGFTLVEFLLVLSIVAFLTVIAIPVLRRPLPRAQLRQQATRILTDMRVFSMRAVAESRTYRVILNPDQNEVSIWVLNGVPQEIKRYRLPSPVTLAFQGADTVDFRPDYRADPRPLQRIPLVAGQDTAWILVIPATGQVYLQFSG